MGILDELANEASTAYSRAKATLLGGSGTNTPAAPAQKAALTQPPVPNYDAANKIEQLAQRSGATDAAFANARAPKTYPTGSSGPANPSYAQGASPEAAAFRSQSGMAGPPAPSTIAGEAAAPRNVPLSNTIQKGIDAAKATWNAQMPSLPSGDGMVARAGRAIGNAGMGVLKTVARVAEPVIEGARVAQVAMDPTMTKGDVAQQVVEGGTRWGATAGGAALGAGLGAMTGPAAPVLSPVGGVVGGIAGYVGGDELVSKVRSMVGLGDKSPAERSSARLAAAAPVATAAAAAKPSNIIPGANGSTVQVNPDGSAQLASRPTDAPSSPAAAPTGRPTISGEAKAATKKKSSPRAAGKAAKASPVAAAADDTPDTSGIDAQIADLQKQQDALGLKAEGLNASTSNGVGTGWVGQFTDKDGARFSNKPMSDQEKAFAERVSVTDAQGKPGETFEKDGKTYINHQVGLDEIGKPLIKAFSADGKADGIGADEAKNYYRQHASFQKDYGSVMSDDQAARVQQYLGLMDKISALQSQKPQPDSYTITDANGNSNVVKYGTGEATPLALEAAGKGQEYRDARMKAQISAANPLAAKTEEELAKIRLQNEGRIAESKIGAGATVSAASIRAAADERSSKYTADKHAAAAKQNVIMQDELVDDGMGGQKTVKRAYTVGADGTASPVGVTQQGADGKGVAGFQNGMVYKDPKTGVSARYNNGKWEPVK